MRTKIGWMAAVGMMVVAFGAMPAEAGTYTWTNVVAGSYNWNTTGNWSNNAAPPSGGATDATIEFFSLGTALPDGLALAASNDLASGSPSDFDLNKLTLNGKATSTALMTYTVQGGTLNFVANGATQPTISAPNQNTAAAGNNAASARVVNNNITLNNVTLTIDANQSYYDSRVRLSGNISGTGNIVRTSSSNGGARYQPVELNGAKTFTGNLTVNGGGQTSLVELGGSNPFNGNVVVNSNARLHLTGTDADWTGSTTVNSGGILQFLIGGNYDWQKDIVNNGDLYLYGANGQTSTVSGNISGTGNLHLSGNGATCYVTGANTFKGKVTIEANGWVYFDSIGDVDPSGTGPATALGRPDSVANGTIDIKWNQYFTYTGSGHSSDRNLNATTSGRDPLLKASGTGPLVLSGNFTVSADANMTFQLDGTNTDENTFSGSILNRSGYSTSLTKSGPGLWVLGGNNTVADYYTGTTTVGGGTLRGTLGTGGSIGSGNLSIAGYHQADAVFESSADIVRPGGSGAGQMNMAAAQVQAWSGFSARGGDINVCFGTLASPESLTWSNAPFNPGSSGKLILNASTADSTLDFKNAINLNAATRTFRVDAATAILSSNLTTSSGTAGLTKEGAGTLVLSGSNTYNGVTTVSAGALRLAGANALPGGIGVSGGTTNLSLAGGVIELGAGDFSRGLGTGATQVQFTSGGFSAYGAARTVNLGGATAGVTWNSGSFVTTTLILGSTTADNKLDFQNPINLNNAARTVRVDDNPATANDYAVLSGVVTNGALIKTGAGLLELAGSTNRFTLSPYLTVSNGTVKVSGVTTSTVTTVASGGTLLVNAPLQGAITVNSGATLGGTGTVSAAALAMQSGAVLQVTIKDSGGPTDALTVSGAFGADNIILNVINTNLLTKGSTYKAIYCTSHTGTFTTNNLPSGWKVDYGNTGFIQLRASGLPGTLLKVQ